jgi:hypothetical protein
VDCSKRSFDLSKGVAQSEIGRQQEIEMNNDNAKKETSVLYWITLGIMFASFVVVALS